MKFNRAAPPADDNDVTTPALDRRRFVALGAAMVGSVAGARSVGATEPSRLWRLNHSWGFPMGPNGSTSCDCNACRHHSENKLFFDRGAAETTRSHLGCRCIAEPVGLRVDVETLRRLSRDGRSVDRRHREVATLLSGTRLLA